MITGATGGLGREIAKLFVEKNCNLFLTGTNNSKLSALSDELKTANKEVKISYCESDLASTEEISKLVKEIRKELLFKRNRLPGSNSRRSRRTDSRC